MASEFQLLKKGERDNYMTDERRVEILESFYQRELETIKTGTRFNAQSFIERGYTRALLVVSIMKEMCLISKNEADKRRHYLQNLKKEENDYE